LLHCFIALFQDKKYSGVAIVDTAGKLTDVLSTRDMKGIANGSILFSRLYLTVKDYKEKVRAEHTPKRGRQIVNTVKWATRDTTMFEVVKQMCVTRVFHFLLLSLLR
jgi:hypothetical protein